MGHLANHLPHRSAQQPGIGVQGDDIADIVRQRAADHVKTGIRSPAQQLVQFGQFAALAFPSHPHAFRRIPQAAAMQEKEPVAIF